MDRWRKLENAMFWQWFFTLGAGFFLAIPMMIILGSGALPPIFGHDVVFAVGWALVVPTSALSLVCSRRIERQDREVEDILAGIRLELGRSQMSQRKQGGRSSE